MESSELRTRLNQGIQAVKANDRPLARELLLQVLDANDRNEPAWLWLSAALDQPADQLMALERVLALNPSHPEALAGVQALRQRLGQLAAEPGSGESQAAQAQPADPPPMPRLDLAAEPPSQPNSLQLEPRPAATDVAKTNTAAEPVMAAEAAAATYDTLASEDDPYQCAYCGRQTHPDDESCRHCQRSLLVPGPWRGGGYLYLILLTTGIQLQSALVQALVSYLVTNYPQSTRILPLAGLWTSHLLVPAILRAIAWAVVVSLLLGDNENGYGFAAVLAVIDLIWAGVGYALEFLAPVQAGANAALGIIIFLIGLMAVISQAQARLRLRVVPDRNLDGAIMFHRRALTYARQGKWALAALHWRRAINCSPDEPLYYKALGRADARLGRYADAVRAFKSGAEAAPNDQEFSRLIEMVRAHARSS